MKINSRSSSKGGGGSNNGGGGVPFKEIMVCVLLLLFIAGVTGMLFFESSLIRSTTQPSSALRTSYETAHHYYHYPPQQHGQHKQHKSLPSGWDEAGQKLYNDEKLRLSNLVTSDPNSVQSHEVLPFQPVRGANSWFQNNIHNPNGKTKWEPQTFTTFFHHVTKCNYYVGFGSWIGPTLFYAAQLIKQGGACYAIEADPVAYAQVETNLALNSNSDWSKHVYLNHHGVGVGSGSYDNGNDGNDDNGEGNNGYEYDASNITAITNPTNVQMKSASAGNSCSGLGEKVACGAPKNFWKVNIYPLPTLLQQWDIPTNSKLFIKVDTESYECKLIPSWLKWIKSIEHNNHGGGKPIFFIAFHSLIAQCTPEEYKDVYQFAILFDNANQECLDTTNEIWTCGDGEHIFYDNI